MASVNQGKIPEYLNENLIRKSLVNGFQDESVAVENFNITPATSAGDNYMSDVFRVRVEYRTISNEEEPCKISLIVKCMPDDGSRGQMLKELDLYEKEAEMYRSVIPELSKIADNEFFSAKLFYATQTPVRMLWFQDLRPLQFTMAVRKTGFDFDHCALVMKKIGKFHAASMLYAKQNMAMLEKHFHFHWYNPDVESRSKLLDGILEKNYAVLLNAIEHDWADFDPNLLAKMKELSPFYVSKFEKCMTQKFDNGFKVLNHGDLWCNNMMFRYDPVSHKAEEVIFLDYQTSNYNSPGLDLNYFLSTCSGLDARDRIDELIEMYHGALSDALASIGYSPIPTLADVYHELDRMEFLALVSVSSLLPIVLMEDTDIYEPSFDTMVNDDELSEKRRKIQFSGKLYRTIAKPLLKKYDEKKLFDV
ncbi:uncharacterized protein LOC129776822 [Toxorhynchites rutilus septentrionalis]|uniref:uncharacterized protein LOC129776822 n=1 Tax=Toxorhynchites rutilus septentrionalis TaxID=329112 RepID=UPI00247AACE1|nr:uncharacterized protein LOC129776822 [Toxorhynchites rutilus septentrionalis]